MTQETMRIKVQILTSKNEWKTMCKTNKMFLTSILAALRANNATRKFRAVDSQGVIVIPEVEKQKAN